MKKEHKEYDASKPLRNRKHEVFAQQLAKNPEAPQSEAYAKVYPLTDPVNAVPSASRLLSNDNVRARVMTLLERSGAGLKRVSERISEHLEQSENLPVSMDACKTVLKVAGVMDEQKQADTSYNPVQINIIIEGKDTQSTMPIDVTAQDA